MNISNKLQRLAARAVNTGIRPVSIFITRLSWYRRWPLRPLKVGYATILLGEKQTMRLISWNVNGIRAVMKKEFMQSFETMAADVLCLQETKAQDEQTFEALKGLEGWFIYTNSAERKGYSGTAIISKKEPISVSYGMGIAEHDTEGRVICAEYPDYHLVTVYTPNSGSELKRLEYRKDWDQAFLAYLQELETQKPVIVCGDLNVAHKAIDLKRPKENYNKAAGYTQTEIDGIDNYIKAGFIDELELDNSTKNT